MGVISAIREVMGVTSAIREVMGVISAIREAMGVISAIREVIYNSYRAIAYWFEHLIANRRISGSKS